MAVNPPRTSSDYRSTPGATATSPGSNALRTVSTLNAVDWIALVLMIVGSINWGLVGLLNFDLVAALFGPMSMVSRVVYGLVGLAGLYGIAMAIKLGASRSPTV